MSQEANRDGVTALVPTQAEIAAALASTWRVMADLADRFTDDDWSTDSPLPGWSIRDVYAHIIGAEKTMSGETVPELSIGSPAHVHNEVGAANEAWIRSMDGLSNAELLTEFRSVAADREAAIKAMTTAEWDAPSWTPAGDATVGRWMHIRVFDCWMHEQDVRIALGLPGGLDRPEADLSLQEVVNALGWIIGKRGQAETGTRLEFRLQRAEETILIRVGVNGRAAVVSDFDGDEPNTVLAMTFEVFMRLVGGRRSARASMDDGLIEVSGDRVSGERFVNNLAFTI